MGNDPGNMVDEDGGWSAGAIGAVAGGVIGGVAGGIIANKSGGGFWGTLGGALGGAFVGAGLGFAGGESLFGNECFNFWTNIKAFYSGLFGGTGNVTGGSMFNGHSALVPDVWGSIGNLNFPNLNFSLWEDFSKAMKPIDIVMRTVQAINPITLQPTPVYDGRSSVDANVSVPPAKGNSTNVAVVESNIVAGSSVFAGANNKYGSDIVTINGKRASSTNDLGTRGQSLNIQIKTTPVVPNLPALPSSRVQIINRTQRTKSGQRLKTLKFIKRRVKINP